MSTDASWIWATEMIHLVDKLPIGDGEKWKTTRRAVSDAFRSLTPDQAILRSTPRGRDREGLIYLAVPYTHPDPVVRQQRFEAANQAAALLMADGRLVFSPISHTHPLVKYGLPVEFDFYRRYDKLFLSVASRMIVLRLDGWLESAGVQEEITIMQAAGKQIEYLDPIALT